MGSIVNAAQQEAKVPSVAISSMLLESPPTVVVACRFDGTGRDVLICMPRARLDFRGNRQKSKKLG